MCSMSAMITFAGGWTIIIFQEKKGRAMEQSESNHRFNFKCIGGPKDGTEFKLEEGQEPDLWDKVALVREAGLHPGYDTTGNQHDGWYYYEAPDRLVYRPFEED